jgi:hypothetical protein
MKKLFRCFIFALLIVSFAAGSSFAIVAEYNEGEVLVVMKAPKGAYSTMSASAYAMALESQATSLAQRKSLRTINSYSALSRSAGVGIAFFKAVGKTNKQLIEELKDDPEVLSVSANYKRTFSSVPREAYSLTNDPMANKQWGMNRINVFETWDNYAKQGQEVYVAVVDTGVDYNHEDLRDNIARDINGKVLGKSFYGNASYTNNDPIDTDGHGTHVAGIIGAVGNNRKGIAGVHYKNIKIIPVNVFTGDGPYDGCWDADLISGINYITELKKSGLNVRVANFSLGGWNDPYSNQNNALQLALQELSDNGVILTFAAGNYGEDISNNKISDDTYCFPASFYMIPNKITVGSMNPITCEKSLFSNYDTGRVSKFNPMGIMLVDMAAPGEYILSTVSGNKYDYFAGSSMSSAFVAGAAALLCSFFPERTATEIVESILYNTFTERGEGKYWINGSLNVGKAYLQFDFNPVTPIIPDPKLEEQRPIVLEISIEGSTIVDRLLPLSVYPNPEGVWSTRPFERAEIVVVDNYIIALRTKSIGEVEVMYTYKGYNKNVVSARKVINVLDIYHRGASGCSASTVSMLMIPFVFFIYMAYKRKKKQ